jgi:hypothetical protein
MRRAWACCSDDYLERLRTLTQDDERASRALSVYRRLVAALRGARVSWVTVAVGRGVVDSVEDPATTQV